MRKKHRLFVVILLALWVATLSCKTKLGVNDQPVSPRLPDAATPAS